MAEGRAGRAGERRRRARRNLAAGVAGAMLVLLVASLLALQYRSATTLRANLLRQHAREVQSQAVALAQLFAGATGDLENAAGSREIATFHENRDLGMSMRYGLGLSLLPIAERLQALVDRPHAGAPSLFRRVVLLDADGSLLAESTGTGSPAWLDRLDPERRTGGARLTPDDRELVVLQPFTWKGRYGGHLVGWLRRDGVARALGAGDDGVVKGAAVALIAGDGRVWRPEPALGARPPRSVDLALLPPDGRVAELGDRAAEEAGAPLLAVRQPVPGQDFSVAHVQRRTELLGDLSAGAGLAVPALAALVVLLGAAAAIYATARSSILEARLQESLRREEEVAEKHRALEAAVEARRRIEGEERRLRRQLLHSQELEAAGVLAGGVAEDFKRLIGTVNAQAEQALRALAPGQPGRVEVGEVLRAGKRAGELTRQLSAFGRRQVLRPEVLDPNAVVTGAEPALRRLLPAGVALAVEQGTDLPPIEVDPAQLEEVLANLVANARDAVPGGGRITIATSLARIEEAAAGRPPDCLPGDYVCLAVTDDGTGMEPFVLEHAFEPFFTTKEVGRGTGLGLSSVYGIVRQSRGFVTARSAPGEGSTFQVFLPARRPQVGTPVPQARAVPAK